ncbi:OB-fold domain-containing protein [Streptomyces sp. NPDC046805]|uniref:Zn-ribbon domain-containing OB-fold protein n=1 Tax=Streptomyces sp. NPDC046805 TaxID=3155134 RepID=UPI0033C4D63A
MKSERTVPTVTPTLAPHFEAAREGKLAIQTCTSCGGHWFPPMSNCPTCLKTDTVTWVETSGEATLWSWVVMHQPYFKAFKDETPYPVAFVKLKEGPILISAIDGVEASEYTFDMPLTVGFEPMGADDLPMPVFRPAAA